MGPIAQLVELPAHNRMVGGSSPSGPTTFSFLSSTNGLKYLGGSLMKRILLVITILLTLSALGATKYAGEIFSFSPGVRNQAMGNTGLTLHGFNSAAWWNPANLAQSNLNGVELMRSEHFEGLLTQNQISLRLDNGIAFSINHLAIDKIKLTKLEDENADLSNDNRPYVWKTVTNQDFILTAGFARRLNPHLALGLSPKLAYRSLAERSGYGIGADLGAFLDLGKGASLGANLRDFFGTQILWESGEHEIALPNFEMELGYQVGLTGRQIPLQLAVRTQMYPEERGDASNFSSSGFSADLHAGLLLQVIPQLSVMAGYDVDSFTAGMGLGIGNWGLDYAFRANSNDGLGYSQRIAASLQW